jgi:hypothetical protein
MSFPRWARFPDAPGKAIIELFVESSNCRLFDNCGSVGATLGVGDGVGSYL